ncbi:MAG: monovalent cation:proton antiporter-2 (CPA2) family protein [Pseudomonadota bacterium]
MDLLQETLIYLVAALLFVPVSRRLGLGSILGYLAGGIVIGPFGLGLIKDPEHILHFAEFGVVLLLFVVGLELKPARLWVLRKMVFGLGALQVVLSAVVIASVALAFGIERQSAVIVGLILALSSTAFVLQMLAEQKQLTTLHGRASFSILLFQDLAAIPLIAFLPLFALSGQNNGFDPVAFAIGFAALGGLVVGGRYLLRPLLRLASFTRIPEMFTATALLVVIGSALLMDLAGLSMVLGAFIAGMLLADSEYRHQLEGDIAPFKGLLLGLFFIAVGMTVNLGLLLENPARIAAIVALLMIAKALVLFPLALWFGMPDGKRALRVAVLLSQGGEFAFVLLGIAARESMLAPTLIDELILAVALSMLLTPLFYFAIDRPEEQRQDGAHDIPEGENTPVIIAGFGRVGQIVGRTLHAVERSFTALDLDPQQVDTVRRFGNRVHYGDATRLDVLRAAGAERAKVLVLVLADMETSLKVAETVKEHFPNLKIVARARNRRHAHKLMDVGVDHIMRDTLLSSVAMAEFVLEDLGLKHDEAQHVAKTFLERDETLLREQHAVHDQEEKLIQSAREASEELAALLKNDLPRSG